MASCLPQQRERKMAIIYRARHMLSGRCYVGSTKRQKGRFREHRIALDSGTHHARYLQGAWNQYGADAFAWEVLETCDDADQFVREQWWIDNTEASLNSSTLAVGGKLPDFGERMSRATKGKARSLAQQDILNACRDIGLANNPANKPGWVPTHRIGVKDTPQTVALRRASRLATEAERREQGLVYVWITNGTNDQKILSTDAVPEGWRIGRKPSFAENARTNRSGEVRDDDARENMRQAQLATNAARRETGVPHHNAGVQQAYCWLTDGVTNLRQLKTAAVPDGFRPGRTFSRY